MQTLEEDNSGDEDLFSEVRSDSGKISTGGISKRINDIRHNSGFKDELGILSNYLSLVERESEIYAKIKEEESSLEKKLLSKYASLDENEVKELIVEHKWISSLKKSVEGEIERVSHKLAGRIIELGDRYSTPLPKLADDAEGLSDKVENHLKEMGFKW